MIQSPTRSLRWSNSPHQRKVPLVLPLLHTLPLITSYSLQVAKPRRKTPNTTCGYMIMSYSGFWVLKEVAASDQICLIMNIAVKGRVWLGLLMMMERGQQQEPRQFTCRGCRPPAIPPDSTQYSTYRTAFTIICAPHHMTPSHLGPKGPPTDARYVRVDRHNLLDPLFSPSLHDLPSRGLQSCRTTATPWCLFHSAVVGIHLSSRHALID